MPKTLPMSIIADELARMRAATPLVHLLTNEVVQEITANVLLAAGASPAMIVAEEEAAAFAAISGALPKKWAATDVAAQVKERRQGRTASLGTEINDSSRHEAARRETGS